MPCYRSLRLRKDVVIQLTFAVRVLLLGQTSDNTMGVLALKDLACAFSSYAYATFVRRAFQALLLFHWPDLSETSRGADISSHLFDEPAPVRPQIDAQQLSYSFQLSCVSPKYTSMIKKNIR